MSGAEVPEKTISAVSRVVQREIKRFPWENSYRNASVVQERLYH